MGFFGLKSTLKPRILLVILCVGFASCNRGTGCPSEEAHTKTNKKGMPTSKAKSGLFDKKMTKKMK